MTNMEKEEKSNDKNTTHKEEDWPLDALIAALKNHQVDVKVKEEAAGALVKIGPPASAPLIKTLQDKSAAVHVIAAEALGKMVQICLALKFQITSLLFFFLSEF